MDALIKRILDAVPDYRINAGFSLTEEKITEWIMQFNKSDRDFVLDEMGNIFEKRYLSEDTAKDSMEEIIKALKKDLGYSSEVDLLLNSYFLDLQEDGKSQKILLGFFDEFIQTKYGIKLKDCGKTSRTNLIYLDDILCTGNTVYWDLVKWLSLKDGKGISTFDKVYKRNSKIILIYFIEHKLNSDVLRRKFWYFNHYLPDMVKQYYFDDYLVNNDYREANASLNFAFPLKEFLSKKAREYGNGIHEDVNELCTRKGFDIRGRFCREENTPKKEILFSNNDNRNRFENILIDTGLKILNSVNNIRKKNIRPLGYDLPTYKSFGFGTLSFTWRNIPNTSPIVFWYKTRDWNPLFEKRGN